MKKMGQMVINIWVLLLVGLVIGGFYLFGNGVDLPTGSTLSNGAKAKITGISEIDIGRTIDDDLSNIIIKISDVDLNSENETELAFNVSFIRDDFLQDVNSAGYIFASSLEGFSRFSSYNTSLDDKYSFVEFTESTNTYTASIDSVSYKNLPVRFELKQGVVGTDEVSITLAPLSDFLNIVENQYDSVNVGSYALKDSTGKTMGRVSIEYTRTASN